MVQSGSPQVVLWTMGLLQSLWNEALIVLWPISPFLSSVLSIHHMPSLLSLYFWRGEAVFVYLAVLGTFVSDPLLSFRHNFLFHANFSDNANYSK